MHGFEIVQLCALRDRADPTLAHSIPTVHALIDHDDVIALLVEDVRDFWPDGPTSAAQEAWLATTAGPECVSACKFDPLSGVIGVQY